MKTLYLALAALLLTNLSWAQNKISGTLINDQNKPVMYAPVQLRATSDSSVVGYATSDTLGNFLINTATAGNYVISVKAMGYMPYSRLVTVKGLTEVGALGLVSAATALNEVSVNYSKPTIEQQGGKTIVNVASNIMAAGNSVYEVLERSPGVALDQNGTIRLNGRQGVQIMIDGKLQPVNGDDLAALLKSIPADQIDKIELINDPSAKYDAAGKGGIIDIRTKKNNRAGTNAGISGSFIQGRYGRANGSFNISHQTKKWNLAAAYTLQKRNDFSDLEINRSFLEDGEVRAVSDQHNYMTVNAFIQTGQFSVDHKLSKKTTIGAVVNGYLNNNTRYINNTSTITGGGMTLLTTTNGSSDYHRFNPAYNLNFRHRFDENGQSLAADVDYASYLTDNIQLNTTNLFLADNTPYLTPVVLYGDLNGKLTIKSARVDYTMPLKGWLNKLEAGGKLSRVRSDNDVAFADKSDGQNLPLPDLSDHFIYTEAINAAYTSLQGEAGAWSYSLGLRVENTSTNGQQINGNIANQRSYTQLFPSFSAGYKINKTHQLDLSFSRRIDRPTYRQLNPFRYYISESTYQVGNPYLQPQLSYNIELSHTINQKFSFKYSYSRTDNYMLQVLIPDEDAAGVVQETIRNLASLNYYAFNASVPVEIGKWFKSYSNLTLYYNKFTGYLVGTPISAGKVTAQFNTNNTFVITPTLSAELNGSYRTAGVDGFLSEKAYGAVGAGMQKQLLNKKLSVKLSITDILRTNVYRGFTSTVNYRENYRQFGDSRLFNLTISYRFGGANAEKKKQTGAEDEKQRAN